MENLKTLPVVYAVGKNYQIIFVAECEMLAWVNVNGKDYFDHSNGVIRSKKSTHIIIVPMDELNAAKKYTLCYRKVNERKVNNSDVEQKVELEFNFRPIENETIRIYNLADTHAKIETPVKAATYSDFDLLIMGGDVPNSVQNIEEFATVHLLAGKATKGEVPVIFAKGNHDLMGICAENFSEYTPTDNGNSYFTFRLGDLWGLVLDCGPDKHDDFEGYQGTMCGNFFRRRQTEFIENVIKNSKNEYKAKGVKKRIVVCHVPFTAKYSYPYDMDTELFFYWTKLLREKIKPQIFFSGHDHKTEVYYVGGKNDYKGQPCPIIMGSNPHMEQMKEHKDLFTGAKITVDNKVVEVIYNDSENNITGTERFLLKTGEKI